MEKIRIIYFGTPIFAASQLEAILKSGYVVVAVVTAPDKPAGRGKKIQFSEVKKTALKHNLPILQPEKLKSPDFLKELNSYQANLFIVVAFRMLPEVVWKIPKFGTFNLHASLLPQYRGAAPINHAIINGEKETGLTTFFINAEIDKGAIVLQEKVEIRPNENAGELHDKLMLMGNRLVVKTIQMLEKGEIKPVKQEDFVESEKTGLKDAPKIFKDFCYIKWDKGINNIFNHIRGLSPYPAAYTQIISEAGEVIDLKVYATQVELCQPKENPYSIITDGKTYLKVALKDGYLYLMTIQQAGKKAMPIADFLRGQHLDGQWKVVKQKEI
jgi:methionyl-tRNA formyltransferase